MLVHLFWSAVFILCCTLLGIIIHELGHLVFGLMLHFRFSYLEIMGFRISKNNLKFSIKFKPKINSKIFMYPIGIRYIIIRTFLYYSGGIIITGIIFIIVCLYTVNTYYTLVLKILALIITIMPLLVYKNSDMNFIAILLNRKKRGIVLIPFYLYNGYSPQEFPDEWFELIETVPLDSDNILLYRMKYYKELESSNDMGVRKYFNILYNTFMRSKYLSDKCEILFFHTMIERNYTVAVSLKEILEEKIVKGTFSSKKRMIYTINHLADKQIKCPVKINGKNPGIKKLEEKLINTYFR